MKHHLLERSGMLEPILIIRERQSPKLKGFGNNDLRI